MDDIISKVFASVPNQVQTIGIKFNLEDLPDGYDLNLIMNDLNNYMTNVTNGSIIMSSAGLHEEGKSEIPHIHYHVVATSINATFKSNRSKHTSAYCMKYNIELPIMSVKQKLVNYTNSEYNEKPNAKYEFVAYPYKEHKKVEHKYCNYFPMLSKDEQIRFEEFLATYANDLHEAKIRKDLSNEASKERKKNAYIELLELAESYHNATKFKSLYELQQFFDLMYLKKLEKTEYPNMRNFSDNVKTIAIALGIEKFYDIYK